MKISGSRAKELVETAGTGGFKKSGKAQILKDPAKAYQAIRNLRRYHDDPKAEEAIEVETLTDHYLFEFETNGAVTGEDAVAFAARILQDQLGVFVNFEEPQKEVQEEQVQELAFNPALLKKVDELELSVRSANCLKNDNIVYIGDLVQKSESEMLRTPNFGRKSLNEIKEVMITMDLYLGMEIDGWPPENIEELAKKLEDPY